MITAVYPGSFDPFTLGHLDVVRRIAPLFDRVVVSVVTNIEKTFMFSMDERMELIGQSVAEFANVEVDCAETLIAEYIKKFEKPVLIKGLRNHVDYEYEATMAVFNRHLDPALETFFITADQRYTYLSSTAVRQLIMFGADLTDYVPNPVADFINKNWR